MNDKIRMVDEYKNVEITPKAMELFENQVINSRRRSMEFDTLKSDERAVMHEQSQINEVLAGQMTLCKSIPGVILVSIPNHDRFKIELCPNKIANKLPGELLSFPEFVDTIANTEDTLSDYGIKTKLSQYYIKANHNSFDVKTDKPYPSYIPVLTQSTLNKSPIRKANARFIDNTLYVGNKNHTITAYDKQTEALEKQGIVLNDYYLRLEIRHDDIPTKNRYNVARLTEKDYLMERARDHKMIHKQIFGNMKEHHPMTILELLSYLAQSETKTNEIYKQIASYAIQQALSNSCMDLKNCIGVTNRNNNTQYLRSRKLINSISSISFPESDEIQQAYYELKSKFEAVA